MMMDQLDHDTLFWILMRVGNGHLTDFFTGLYRDGHSYIYGGNCFTKYLSERSISETGLIA